MVKNLRDGKISEEFTKWHHSVDVTHCDACFLPYQEDKNGRWVLLIFFFRQAQIVYFDEYQNSHQRHYLKMSVDIYEEILGLLEDSSHGTSGHYTHP